MRSRSIPSAAVPDSAIRSPRDSTNPPGERENALPWLPRSPEGVKRLPRIVRANGRGSANYFAGFAAGLGVAFTAFGIGIDARCISTICCWTETTFAASPWTYSAEAALFAKALTA